MLCLKEPAALSWVVTREKGGTDLARMVGSPGPVGVVLAACILDLIRKVLKSRFPCQ